MTLGPKDIVGTIAAGLVAYIGWLAWKTHGFPWHISYRWAAVIILGAGLASCIAFSSKTPPDMHSPFVIALAVLGGLSLVMTGVALIKPGAVVVEISAAIIILMWLITTIRHFAQ